MLRRALLLSAAGTVLPSARAEGSDWPADPPAPGPALQALLDEAADLAPLRGLAVAHGGRLVALRAYGSATTESLLRIHSATKSVSGLLVGIALAQGRLRSLDLTLGELLPEDAAAQPGSAAIGVTLRQVLTGTTNLAFDWMAQGRALATAADPVAYAFGLPRDARPAGTWSYNDAAIALLSSVLERAFGEPLDAAARRHLFEPLGIAPFAWQRDRTGRPMAYAGLQLRTRDLLKLAWLMVDGGRWQGRQLLTPDWVTQSTTPQVGGAWPNPPIADSAYGQLWFTGRWRGQPVAWAWGYGAQFALLAPTLRVAIATAASEPPPQQLPAQNRAIATLVTRILDSLG